VDECKPQMRGRVVYAVGDAAARPGGDPRSRGPLRLAAAGWLQGDLAAVFYAEVLPLLDATTRALHGRCGQACRDAVLRSPKLPCAGRTVGVKPKVKECIVYVQLLAWAKEDNCRLGAMVCSRAAQSGHLQALEWAREHNCKWKLHVRARGLHSSTSQLNLSAFWG
jgi:hypothetical protein